MFGGSRDTNCQDEFSQTTNTNGLNLTAAGGGAGGRGRGLQLRVEAEPETRGVVGNRRRACSRRWGHKLRLKAGPAS